jgi:hypothetical protein
LDARNREMRSSFSFITVVSATVRCRDTPADAECRVSQRVVVLAL